MKKLAGLLAVILFAVSSVAIAQTSVNNHQPTKHEIRHAQKMMRAFNPRKDSKMDPAELAQKCQALTDYVVAKNIPPMLLVNDHRRFWTKFAMTTPPMIFFDYTRPSNVEKMSDEEHSCTVPDITQK